MDAREGKDGRRKKGGSLVCFSSLHFALGAVAGGYMYKGARVPVARSLAISSIVSRSQSCSCSTGNVGLRALGVGAPTHTSGVLTRRSSHTPSIGSLFFAVSVTSGVVSSQSSHMPCVSSLFFTVSITPGVVSSQSSHTPCVGSLFFVVSVTPSAISSQSSHMPCVGTLFFAVSVPPGVVSSRSSHTPCVGSLFVLGVGGRSAGSRVERDRSVERDNIVIRSNMRDTTGLLHSSLPYHPHGAPIFLINVPILLLACE